MGLPREVKVGSLPEQDAGDESHASSIVRGGAFLFVSGLVAVDANTGARMPGTTAAETAQILANLEALLERAGSSLDLPSFHCADVPTLGTTWMARVDARNHPAAAATLLVGYGAPLAGLSTPLGELLVDPRSRRAFLHSSSVTAGVSSHSIGIPNDLALIDVPIFTQAAILGGGTELTNAIDLVLGF